MKEVIIGKSDIKASAIGMGCMRITDMPVLDVANLINTALEEGINLFDHADIYGGGKAEEVFAAALKEVGCKREELVIQSKCGIRPGVFDFSKEYILKSADNILNRLSMEYLDILMLHRPDTLMELDEVSEAFETLKKQGKVRQFGVSNMNRGQLELLEHSIHQPIVVNQLQYSLAHTGMIDAGFQVNMKTPESIVRDGGVLEYSRMKHITIQTWSSLQYGFFEGTFINHPKYEKLNEVLSRFAVKYEVTPAAIAIAWILRHPAKMQAIVGSTNPIRLKETAKAAQVELSREEWYELYLSAGNILP